MTMHLRNVLIGTALIFVLLAYLFFKNTFNIKQIPANLHSNTEQSTTYAPSVGSLSSLPGNEERIAENQSKSVGNSWTTEDQAIYSDWITKRGYTAFSDNEYGSYNEETLTALAKEGDIRAIEKLGDLNYHHGYGAALPYYLDAATRGSTQVFVKLASIEDISNYSNAKTDDEKHKYALRVMVWCEVANLRGDRWPAASQGNYLMTKANLALSEQDKKYISLQAKDIYQRLQEQRNEMGLGEFDNSVPDAVNRKVGSWERGNATNRDMSGNR